MSLLLQNEISDWFGLSMLEIGFLNTDTHPECLEGDSEPFEHSQEELHESQDSESELLSYSE